MLSHFWASKFLLTAVCWQQVPAGSKFLLKFLETNMLSAEICFELQEKRAEKRPAGSAEKCVDTSRKMCGYSRDFSSWGWLAELGEGLGRFEEGLGGLGWLEEGLGKA